jgi:Chitobiase/beta-hexosaminidase C-terminal domain
LSPRIDFYIVSTSISFLLALNIRQAVREFLSLVLWFLAADVEESEWRRLAHIHGAVILMFRATMRLLAGHSKICDVRVLSSVMFSFPTLGDLGRLGGSTLICLLLFTLPRTPISVLAQNRSRVASGLAWQIQGMWQVEGKDKPILLGSAIEPGSLLRPGQDTINHSITILLPDGQRILYECFTVEDCARGFRVPSLYRRPDPFAVDMVARIHAVLLRGNDTDGLAIKSSLGQDSNLPRDEIVAVLDSSERVKIAGLAGNLSNGRYTYDVQPLDRAYQSHFHLAVEKSAAYIAVELPSLGVYVLTISDELNTPRINLFIAAVSLAQAASITNSFSAAKTQMKEWNREGEGWPIHDFLRAYLESLMLGAMPSTTGEQASAAKKIASNAETAGSAESEAAVTAEPTFSPKPGVSDGDTAVTLRCETPGAILYYTVDGSQPVANSPVYDAPIMVIGTELTIKSFASVAGKKDSAVVTGVFRIRQ